MDEIRPTVSLKGVRCYMRNVLTRMPFRYGVATLTAVPILHVVAEFEVDGEHTVTGISADILPPKWFDKRPEKTYADNVTDLLKSFDLAVQAALGEPGPLPVFELWLRVYQAVRGQADAHDLNPLTAGHGPSLVERAAIDALGRHVGEGFHALVKKNVLGIRPGALHPTLEGICPTAHLPEQPQPWMMVRHTVGLSDPLTEADLTPDDTVDDGLPQTLERYLAETGIAMLKVKVQGDLDADLARLHAIAELVERHAGQQYGVSLDGNEQYQSFDEVAALLEGMRSTRTLSHFYHHLVYLEQPVERGRALNPDLGPTLRKLCALKPVIIDESDGELGAFAQAVEIGYRGVSSKNCKGVQKAIVNSALAHHLTKERGEHYFMTGEDLMNLPVVSLHQDLATLSTLGLSHAERNGHHYVAGLDHLSAKERDACLQVHAPLYEPWRESARLRIVNGTIALSSLHACSGYAVGIDMDLDSMTPLNEWEFSSLGIEG